MATLPQAIANGTVTENTNPASSLYAYWTDGNSDFYVTIANLLKNPSAIGSGTPSSGAFTTLSSTGVASLDSLALTTDLAVAHGGTGASTAAGARSNLGLVIGTNVQAYDAGLQSIAGLTTAADRMIYTTASDTYAVATLTAFARSILDDADAATVRATLDVDQAGTDNSTDVTLAGAYNYLTIAGQEITLNQIDLTTDVTGSLPASNAAFADQNVLTTSSPTFAGATIADLTFATGSITAGGGVISFGNENLSTGGDLTVGGTIFKTGGNIVFDNTVELRWEDSVGTERTAVVLDGSNVLNVGTSAGGGIIFRGNSYANVGSVSGAGNWDFQSGSITTTGTLASGNATVSGTLGVTGTVNLTGGKLNTAASTTARASLNIPSGTPPTSPTDGDIWSDGSDLLIRLGGTTYTLQKA